MNTKSRYRRTGGDNRTGGVGVQTPWPDQVGRRRRCRIWRASRNRRALPSEPATASAPSAARPTPSLASGDTSNGADNFYASGRVPFRALPFGTSTG